MKTYYFAGGGTGGHLYPGLAIAEELKRRDPQAKITFFCSNRPIDARILSTSEHNYVPLPASPPGKSPKAILKFIKSFRQSEQIVRQTIGNDKDAVLITIGGFVSAPAVRVAKNIGLDIYMLNIDAVAGKANKFCGRAAKKVFVQFEITAKYFGKKTIVTGSPLRSAFAKTDRPVAIAKLGLSPKKKTLLITGASGGAANINGVIGLLLDKLESFANDWQIVHLAGITHYNVVRTIYKDAKINLKILDFCDDMPELLACADLAISRAGAMSIAELAASATPAIYLPYPYHRDKHQQINAAQLEKYDCGRIVTDMCDTEKTARLLWPVLAKIMNSPEMLEKMRTNCLKNARTDAAKKIADEIMK
ncbi:MAG: UDP-N-acetylglucosamine--N-acetylmuramyl-(pentapeptide) pyrophosphoryl-undecaprenol N-acetylglucosamine transferase [Anaerohalosphaeraceae bacterium]|nr:UDP-N-acetylglucosamine--N-acetylmuramyl-(pentapeptide) pyrophosphoryl-undecaprenol N-acetylglucosamine transferase [Anaerohalosphaeraceae bacterium]